MQWTKIEGGLGEYGDFGCQVMFDMKSMGSTNMN